jgi:ribosomal protein L34E
MARKTTIEYSCDSCGRSVEGLRDLQRFTLQRTSASGRRNHVTATGDFCDECETRFLAAVEPFYPAEEIPRLHAMSREEE